MLFKRNTLRKVLSADDLKLIAQAIGEAEMRTAGEIRVSIHERRHRRERKVPLHELALQEFHRLGMQNTRDRTGILIYILFSERKFHIVADEGIHKVVAEGTWNRIADKMSHRFRAGEFRDGIIDGVKHVGEVLAAHVPRRPDDTNELPNTVQIG